jgi:hypothetical protein
MPAMGTPREATSTSGESEYPGTADGTIDRKKKQLSRNTEDAKKNQQLERCGPQPIGEWTPTGRSLSH